MRLRRQRIAAILIATGLLLGGGLLLRAEFATSTDRIVRLHDGQIQ